MKEKETNSGLVVARPGLVREGLQAVLSAIPRMHVLEPADDGPSALDRLKTVRPNLVILDSSLPEDELRTTLRQIKVQWPNLPCIVIAASPRQGRVMEASEADAVLIEGVSATLLSTTIKALVDRPRPFTQPEEGGEME